MVGRVISDAVVRIDGYPVKIYWINGVSQRRLRNFHNAHKVLKLYLVERFKVCYFCKIKVVVYELEKGQPVPDDMATIEHLIPRTHGQRKRHQIVAKVLACRKCNHDRNIEQLTKAKEAKNG